MRASDTSTLGLLARFAGFPVDDALVYLYEPVKFLAFMDAV